MSFVENIAKHEKYDLVHLDTAGLFPYAKIFSDTPLILNHHNIESQMMLKRYEKEKKFFRKTYFKREARKIREYERNICLKCVMNLVVSDLDALRLKETIGDNINMTVIPNGVDLEYFKPSKCVDHNIGGLVFAGGMSYYPNREAMLYFLHEIWPILRKDNPNRRVTIVGRNPPKELCNIDNEPNIVATGYVEDVRPYIDSAKIYICPITNGGGTRLKILDALAMAKPLVATAFAVEGLGLVEEEHYLRADNASEFVAQIKRLENDDRLCKNISSAGRRFVESRYSWEIIGEKLEETYRKAAN
jgi:glycosyltransferase involved in cell wall biosynthesis